MYEQGPQEGDMVQIQEWRNAHGHKLRALEAALEALAADPFPPWWVGLGVKTGGAARVRWGLAARSLAWWYRHIVGGKGSTTRNGPAVRFITEALNRTGFQGFGVIDPDAENPSLKRKRGVKAITPAAVEGLLRRRQ